MQERKRGERPAKETSKEVAPANDVITTAESTTSSTAPIEQQPAANTETAINTIPEASISPKEVVAESKTDTSVDIKEASVDVKTVPAPAAESKTNKEKIAPEKNESAIASDSIQSDPSSNSENSSDANSVTSAQESAEKNSAPAVKAKETESSLKSTSDEAPAPTEKKVKAEKVDKMKKAPKSAAKVTSAPVEMTEKTQNKVKEELSPPSAVKRAPNDPRNRSAAKATNTATPPPVDSNDPLKQESSSS
jgi:hypothetical protein